MPSRPNQRETLLPSLHTTLSALLPILLPLGVLLLQALLWDLIAPFGWIAFLPVVALCSWVCGLRGGLLSLIVSVGAVEWLLIDLPEGQTTAAESRIFSALLFSVLAAGVMLVLDRARRERQRLHLGVLEMQVAAFGFPAATVPPGTLHWWSHNRAYAEDLPAIVAVRRELEWRRQCLTLLQVPLATFCRDGRCLFANPAFQSAMRLHAEDLKLRNGLDSGHFPGTGLPAALRRLLDQPLPRQPETFRLPGAGEFSLVWMAIGDDGLAVCAATGWLQGTVSDAAAASAIAAAAVVVEPAAAAAGMTAPQLRSAGWRSITGLRCLVVDDQEINRELLREILRLEGAVPVCCASGREALAAISAAPEDFDVVLMDLQMPGMDGYAAARAIRFVVDSEHLPILAITADGPGVPAARLRDAGIQGLLHKPLEVERMLALLSAPRGALAAGSHSAGPA